jgi:hypothetical protein
MFTGTVEKLVEITADPPLAQPHSANSSGLHQRGARRHCASIVSNRGVIGTLY